MSLEEFLRFLPSGDLLNPIFSFVRYMVGIEYEFEVRVLLKRDEVPSCILGAKIAGSAPGVVNMDQKPGS